MKLIKDFIDRQRERNRNDRDRDIREEFKLGELGGDFWITHNGVGIVRISPLENMESVASRLHELREAAIDFDKSKRNAI